MSLDIDKDLERLENNTVVFERSPNEPFEAPVKEIEKGPLYVTAQEVVPEVTEAPRGEAGEETGPKLNVDRRDFMRLFSATAALGTAACVRRPVEKALPYVQQPVDQVPGQPVYYATTCGECASGCGFIVRTREGRPTKLEGNPKHPISQGATCSLGQSSLQALFHPDRRKHPMIRFGQNRVGEVSWDDVYERMAGLMKTAKNVAIVTHGSTGHRNDFYRDWLTKLGYNKENLYVWESNSLYAQISAAHKAVFGVDGMPRTELRRSELIVNVGSDFLDSGISPVYDAKSWTASHGFRHGAMGKMVSFESRLTQTGIKAAERYPIAPGDELAVALLVTQALAKQSGAKGSAAEKEEIRRVLDANATMMNEAKTRLGLADSVFDQLAADMLAKPSILMAGGSGASDENGTLLQVAAIMANVLCGAYGSTLFLDKGWFRDAVQPGDYARFMKDAPSIDVLFVIDSNPVFTLPESSGIQKAMKAIPTVVSIQPMPTEVDLDANFILNSHNYLESWGDEETVAGFWSLRQPTVRPVTDSRQAEDILLWVAAALEKPMGYREYRDYLMEKWKTVHKAVSANVDFDTFFKAVQRRGFVGKLEQRAMPSLRGVAAMFKPAQRQTGGLKLVAYLHPHLRDGRGANRPVLQEVGDALTSIAWDTWVAISPSKAKELGLRYNDVVKVEGAGGTFEAAVFPQPGLHPDTIAVPRGNGHWDGSSKITQGVGVNPLIALAATPDVVTGELATAGQTVTLTKTGKIYRLAAMQKSTDLGNRSDIVKTISLDHARANEGKTIDLDAVPDLYPSIVEGIPYRWGMSIDLTKCTGCAACSVACSVENNVPQVGREQVLIGREMHWLRLDHYFAGSVDNPKTVIQPMLCQHCMHAPCEAVCPVYATTHDPEGINSQTYNRCVGTRYCANACPYKIRRFNWFTHKWNVTGEREQDRNPRAVNPDVTIRTRGIMEKCTFCVQRIREAKHGAKQRGGPDAKVMDGEVQTACQQVCPSDAIVFGNLLDPQSRVATLRRDPRAYLALGGEPEHGHYGLKTLPNVSYLALVENDGSQGSAGMPAGHGEPHAPMDAHGAGDGHGHE